MSKDVLYRLKDANLYKILLEREQGENGNSLISSKTELIVSTVGPLLERVVENMPEYTLHDPNHSAKVLEIMDKILPEQVKARLNSVEISLLILSCYLHDIGMTCSREEKEDIIKSKDFEILLRSNTSAYERYSTFLSVGDHRSATFIQDQIFTEYLRKNHVKRSADYIQRALSKGNLELSFQGIPYWKRLIAICNGHGESVESLSNVTNWPRHTLVGDKIINVQYLTLVLRLADILDLDPERTPQIIYDFVNPQNPVSLLEWKKHRSILGHSINAEKILFEAECPSPEVERALKQFMGWIEIERKGTMSLLAAYTDEIAKQYFLTLNEEVAIDRIRPNGSYISNDLKFEIDYKRVLDLLMGQRLYKNPVLALRELLQNSFDAIKLRSSLYKDRLENFSPYISISFEEDTLIVSDNGIGMDDSIFQNFFLQVGKSYYSSREYYSRFSEVDVTSEFGIGVLSAFMIADSIVVESRREPQDPFHPPLPIYFEIPTAYSYTVQRETSRTEIGTCITLRLKQNHPFKAFEPAEILAELMPNPPFPIAVFHNGLKSSYHGLKQKDIPFFRPDDLESISSTEDYIIHDYEFERTKFFTHRIVEMTFGECAQDEVEKDIEGRISIVNTNIGNFYPTLTGYITQRHFRIGTPVQDEERKRVSLVFTDNIQKLFPDWTSFYCEINLTGKACLTLTPDRTDVIVDEKYNMLATRIQSRVLKALESLFKQILTELSASTLHRYTDFLIQAGFVGRSLERDDSRFQEMVEDLFKTYFFLPVLEVNGEVKRRSLADISENGTIGYLSYAPPKQQLPDLTKILLSEQITLIIFPSTVAIGFVHLAEGIISGILGDGGKLLAPHTELTSALPNFLIHIIKNKGETRKCDDYNMCNLITDSLKTDRSILFIPRGRNELYPRLNISHRLISCCFDQTGKYVSDECKKLVQKLAGELSDSLLRYIKESMKERQNYTELTDYTLDILSVNYFKLACNILSTKPALISDFEAHCNDFLKEVKKLGLYTGDAETAGLSEADFPASWF